MNVLVACEESQAVTKAFRKLGIDAYSCDLLPCSGGHPEWHFNMDVFQLIENGGGTLQSGKVVIVEKWDLMIAHPPCTFLAVSGARWFYDPEDASLPIEKRRPHPKFPNRRNDQKAAVEFIKNLWDSDIDHIAIENPIGVLSSVWKKPNQIVQPYHFGDEASKSTCLWLKGLPNLSPTKIVGKGEMVVLKSGKKLPKWYSDALVNSRSTEERRTLRSKTFEGIANAMAMQWSTYVENYGE